MARGVLGVHPAIAADTAPQDITRIEYRQVAELAQQDGLQPALGPDEFVGLACASFNEKLDRGVISFKGRDLDYVFLPPDFGEWLPGENPVVEDTRTDFNTRMVLKILFENNFARGLHPEDVLLFHGAVRSGMSRTSPYTLIQIPRLNREILVCDEVGEAAFVSQSIRSPIFWASYGKLALSHMEGVQRILRSTLWKEKMISALFTDNAVGLPLSLTVPRKDDFPITADLVIMNALREIVPKLQGELGGLRLTPSMDFGRITNLIDPDRLREVLKLPTQNSGSIRNLPGQEWANWSLVVRLQRRGFDISNLGGLSGVFGHFGLKQGNNEAPDRILQAIANVIQTGHHGLEPNPPPPLTTDFMICKLLDYAEKKHRETGEYQFPRDNSTEEVPGMPGQKWSAWRGIIEAGTQGRRGFDLDGVTGVNHLLNLYQLMLFQRNHTDRIKNAIEHLRIAREHDPASLDHGLTRLETKTELSHDYFLGKALRHAEFVLNNAATLQPGEELPTHKSALPRNPETAILGMAGYTVRLVNQMMGRENFGYRQDGIKTLAELYRAYGLVDAEGREDRPAIHQAVARLNRGEGHGLMRRSDYQPRTTLEEPGPT